jgi:uncharacterized membrane protein YqaE (UPF0057 family)
VYLVAVLLPPLAVLLCGKPAQALLNVLLTLLCYVPGLLHARMVVAEYQADRRSRAALRAERGPRRR